MSYLKLAESLEKIAKQLRKHESQLEGKELGSVTNAFEQRVQKFASKLTAHIEGGHSGGVELERLVKQDPRKKLLKLPEWKKLYQDVIGKRVQGATVAEVRKKFLNQVEEHELEEVAVEQIKAFYLEAMCSSQAIPKERIELQKELLRLGELEEDALDYELKKRYGKITDLRKLADANAIRYSKKTTKQTLTKNIIHYAKRAYQNVKM